MKTTINVILAFAGSGKTTLASQMVDSGKVVVDLDPAPYSKEESFPYNYLEALKVRLTANPEAIVLMSTHEDVVTILRQHSIPHLYVYPDCSWEEWSPRFERRKDTPSWIAMMESRWPTFKESFKKTPNDRTTIKLALGKDEYLNLGILQRVPMVTW